MNYDIIIAVFLVNIFIRGSTDGIRRSEPVFLSSPLHLEVVAGNSVVLPCRVANLGDHSLVWSQGRRVLTARTLIVDPDERISLDAGFSLTVKNITRHDSGPFTCSVSSTPITELTHTVTVLYTPEISVHGTDSVEDGIEMLHVREYSDVILHCNASGNPQPKIYWRKQNANALPNTTAGSLSIERIGRQMSGLYQCVAENGIGNPQALSVLIRVQYPPEITRLKSPVFTGNNHNVRLVCIVNASPVARVTWRRSQLAFDAERHFSIRDDRNSSWHVLVVQHVQDSDLGTFTCHARNRLGQSTAIFHLTGVPMRPRLVSRERSEAAFSYRPAWQVISYSPVREYRVAYTVLRNSSSVGWKTVVVPARAAVGVSPAVGTVYQQQILLSQLVPASIYQLHVQAGNRHGWSAQSSTLTFRTLSRQAAMEIRSGSLCPHDSVLTLLTQVLLLHTVSLAAKNYIFVD